MLTLQISKVVDLDSVLQAADDLVDEPGSNPEYERALVELAAALFGIRDGAVAQYAVRVLLGWTEDA